MSGFFDFFGFGSKRRSALQAFDRSLIALEVNPAYIDDGMRYLIYKWAEEHEAALPAADPSAIDRQLADAAQLISYCVLGPAETENVWGPAVRAARQARFEAALGRGDEEDFDVRLIKLVLAKEVAASDIRAVVSLD